MEWLIKFTIMISKINFFYKNFIMDSYHNGVFLDCSNIGRMIPYRFI